MCTLLSIHFCLCCYSNLAPHPTSLERTTPDLVGTCLDEGTNITNTFVCLNTSLCETATLYVNRSTCATTHAIATTHQRTNNTRLWALEWSRKSVAKVTGLSVKALRTLQRKGQAKQRARAPMRTRLSNNTLRGIANVHAIPRTRSKHLVQTFPHPAGTWMRRPCEQKALRWLTALQDPQVPQPLHKAIQQMPLEDIKILYRTCKMIAPICLEYISAEPELILHGASSGSLDFGTAHQTNPTTPNADYED
jgi:hypothetical protein